MWSEFTSLILIRLSIRPRCEVNSVCSFCHVIKTSHSSDLFTKRDKINRNPNSFFFLFKSYFTKQVQCCAFSNLLQWNETFLKMKCCFLEWLSYIKKQVIWRIFILLRWVFIQMCDTSFIMSIFIQRCIENGVFLFFSL